MSATTLTPSPLPEWALPAERHPTDSTKVLAPFNLDAAKAGVPVCYRHGGNPLDILYFGKAKVFYRDSVTGEWIAAHQDLRLLLPAPPKGWALLRAGEPAQEGDRRYHSDVWQSEITYTDGVAFKDGRIYARKLPAVEWRLPDPPPGEQWHRTDGWTQDMLPDGWRPLLFGECEGSYDKELDKELRDGRWIDVREPFVTLTSPKDSHTRTRRPLPAVEQPTWDVTVEPTWIPWAWNGTLDSPVPGETLVETKLRNGHRGPPVNKAKNLNWLRHDKDNPCTPSSPDYEIVAYRVVEPAPAEELTLIEKLSLTQQPYGGNFAAVRRILKRENTGTSAPAAGVCGRCGGSGIVQRHPFIERCGCGAGEGNTPNNPPSAAGAPQYTNEQRAAAWEWLRGYALDTNNDNAACALVTWTALAENQHTPPTPPQLTIADVRREIALALDIFRRHYGGAGVARAIELATAELRKEGGK